YALARLARAHVGRGDMRAARRVFAAAVDAAVSCRETSRAVGMVAQEMIAAGWYAAALETAFGSFQAVGTLGMLAALARRRAWPFLLAAIPFVPEGPRTLGFLSLAQAMTGDLRAASATYARCRAAAQEAEDPMCGWPLAGVATALARQGSHEAALQ